MRRYQRQVILPQIRVAGQRAISNAKVLIVGAGGLGTPAAQYLVASGIGHITIVDGDEVSFSNLHRQVLFHEKDVGSNKAKVLCKKLFEANPDCQLTAIDQYLSKDLAIKLFDHFDIVIDGTDNFSAKYLINDVASFYKKPVVYGAISQFEGQVSVFWKGKGPCYRCIYPSAPKSTIKTCAEAGVLGALPGIIGSMQAMECIKVILHKENSESPRPLVGEMAVFDFEMNSFHSFQLTQNSTCSCCSRILQLDEIDEWRGMHCEINAVHNSCHKVIRPEIKYIIDVRSQEEWEEFHIPGSIHWPVAKLEQGEFPNVDKNAAYYCVCISGARAQKSSELLHRNGFKNASFLTESIYEYSN